MSEATKMSDGQDWNNPIELSSIEWNNLDQMGRAEMTGYQAGLRDERQRIIKLIESQITPCLCEQGCMADDNPTYQELIELIKGESK